MAEPIIVKPQEQAPVVVGGTANIALSGKQDRIDNSLLTNDKSIVGAINELKLEVGSQDVIGFAYNKELNSFAAGDASTATGQNSFSEGWGTYASGNQSHAEGNQTIASAPQAHAEGWGTQAANNGAHAEGDETIASGAYSHAEGEQTQAVENYAHAEGKGSIAAGAQSHAEGNSTKTFGNQSHAEGYGSQAIGNGAHAEGDSTVAYAPYSHAEGANSRAGYYGEKPTMNGLMIPSNTGDDRGGYAHAEGAATLAVGKASHAEGCKTIATGENSHAEGYYSHANGEGSHAEGLECYAEGAYSHAEGIKNYAHGEAEHVCGKFATVGGNAIMKVGVGIDVSNRRDGFAVYTDGTFKFGSQNGDFVMVSVDDLKVLLAGKPTVLEITPATPINTQYLTEAVISEIIDNRKIIFDAKIRRIWDYAFKDTAVKKLIMPDDIMYIGRSSFENGCDIEDSESIRFSQNLKSIGERAFYGSVIDTPIVLPNSLQTIGEQAFERCSNFKSIILGDNCTSVGRQAFYGCTSLESITFGAATTLILGGCINGCTSLKTITCKAVTPPELYAGNYLTNVEAVYVPAESVEAYKAAPQWSSYANVIIPIS